MKNKLLLKMLIFLCILLFLNMSVTAADGEIEDMRFKEADIRDVLEAISEAAEKNLVIDGSVKGEISIHLRDISFDKALKMVTQTHDFTYRWDDNTIFVATPERIDSLYEEATTEIIDLEGTEMESVKKIITGIFTNLNVQINESEEQIIFTGKEKTVAEATALLQDLNLPRKSEKELVNMKVKHVDLDDIISSLEHLFPDITAVKNDKRRQLILQGEEEKIDKAVSLVKQMDESSEEFTEESGEETAVIDIEFVELDNITRIVSNIYSELIIEKSPETGQLIIHGKEENIKLAQQLIENVDRRKTDSEDEESEEKKKEEELLETRELEHIEIEQVQEKIKDVYPDLKTEDDDVNNQIIIEGNKDKVNKALSLAKKMDQEHKLITEIIRIDYIELEQAQNIIEETIPDLTLNMESHNSNLIMVGKEKEVNQGKELIKKLDNPSKQVLLEVQIEEIQRDKLAELGPGFEELRNLSSLDFIKSGEGNLEGVEVDWPRLLRILENRDISQTLANPSLMTSDGEEAKLLIGDQIPYQQTETREDEQVTNYEYMDVGITLEFEPSISKDELILLDVKPQISSIGSRSGNSPLPELKTREVETQISLKDGEGFAIGGLIQDDIVQDISQVPVLSSIPILGRLFRSTKEEDIRTEVIIFITPHIVDPLEDGVKDTGVDKYIEEKTDQKRGSNILERFLRLQEEKMLEDKTGNNAEEKMRLYGIDGKSLNSGDADDYKIQEGEDWILSVPLF